MTPRHEQDLGRIFAYDALDLVANSNGYLSDAQKHRLRRQIDHSRIAFIIAGTIGMLIIFIGYIVADITGLLVGIAADGILMGVALLSQLRTNRILNGEVRKVEGRPLMGERTDFRDTAEFAHIQFGRVVFRLSPHITMAFSPRGYYRVYYLPGINIIVAVEEL